MRYFTLGPTSSLVSLLSNFALAR